MNHHATSIALSAVLGLSTVSLAAPPTIQELAPDGTIFVAGARDVARTMTRLKATSLWDLWQSPELVDARKDARKAFDAHVEEMMHDLDLDADTLQMPTGGLGLAVFTVMNAELGLPQPGFLLSADYGEHAEKTAEILEAARRQAKETDEIVYEERDVRGRTVYCIETPEPEAPADEGDPDDWGTEGLDDMGGMGGMDAMGGDIIGDALSQIFVVRDETLFLVSSDMATIAHALEVIDGATDPVLTGRDDYKGLMAQLGEGDVTAAVLTKDLGALVSAVDPMGMAMMFAQPLQQMVGDIEGCGFGARLDGPDAMVEMTEAVYMPNGKIGLTALLEQPGPCGEVPSFAGANAMSLTTVNFDFRGLPDAVRPIVQMMQMMMPPEPGAGPGIDQTIEQITSCLGRRAHIVQTLDQPVEVDSLKQVMAVECPKPQELEHFLSLLAQDMGMDVRDFRGHRIYTLPVDMTGMMPMDMPMEPVDPPAIGLGGGYLFTGPAPAVEQALRSTGDAGNATLADDPVFRRAVAVLGSDPAVGWGYTNLVDCYDAGMKISRKQMENLANEMEREEFAMPDGQDMPAFEDLVAQDWTHGLDAALLRRHLGPMVWKLNATNEGFVVRAFVLDAGE